MCHNLVFLPTNVFMNKILKYGQYDNDNILYTRDC